MTCYGCNATDHVFQICPKRLETTKGRRNEQTITWAHVARHGTQKTNNGETKNKNDPTNNIEPKDGEHITEEGTEMDTEPEGSLQAGPSIPIEQEQDTPNTDLDNRRNMYLPGTNKTERQISGCEEDEKCGDEQILGPNPLQVENQKPMSTEMTTGNETTERVNTNRMDKTNNGFRQNPQGEMKDVQEVHNNPQRRKNSNLKATSNRQPKGKGAGRETRHKKDK